MEEEKSYYEIRKDLYEKYNTILVPELGKYSKEWYDLYVKYRIRSNKDVEKGRLPLLFDFFLMCGSFYMFFYTISEAYKDPAPVTFSFIMQSVFFWIIMPAIPIYMIFVIFYDSYKRMKNLYKTIKNEVMTVTCECFPDLKYIPEGYHSSDKYKKACILPNSLSITYDDCFIGKHKDVEFVIEELKTNGLTDSFKGVSIQFKINKKFSGHTIIYPDSYLHTYPSLNLHHTELEDVVFERKYDVYTNEDVEARYLITPGFMKRLSNVKSTFDADKIYAAFFEGVFYLALNTNKNFFEISSDKKICDKGMYYNMIAEIISIYKLIDHFKLDQKIGM